MFERVVENEPWLLKYVPDYLKTQKMFDKTFETGLWQLKDAPDNFRIEEMCIESVEVFPWQLKYVLDNFNMQDMCNEAVGWHPYLLQYVPDWFVTREGVDMWYDDSEYCDNDADNFFKCYDLYRKRKTQKASIKIDLTPIAWHASRWWDWCMSEDETRDTEAFWA